MTDRTVFRKNLCFDVPHVVTVVAGLASIVAVTALVIITRGSHPSRTLLIATSTGGAIVFTLFLVGLVSACRQKTKKIDDPTPTVMEPAIPRARPQAEEPMIAPRDVTTLQRGESPAQEGPRQLGPTPPTAPDDASQEGPRQLSATPAIAPDDATQAANVDNLNKFMNEILPQQMKIWEDFLSTLLRAAQIPDNEIEALRGGLHQALIQDYQLLFADGTITIEQAVLELDSIIGIGCKILVHQIGQASLTCLCFLRDKYIRNNGQSKINGRIDTHFTGPLSDRQSCSGFMKTLSPYIVEFGIKLIRTGKRSEWLQLFEDAGEAMKTERSTPLIVGSAFIANGIRTRQLAF